MKDIPIYDISIDDAEELQGVSKISLVDMPAIGVNFIALRKESKPKGFMKKECFGDGSKITKTFARIFRKPKAFIKKECLGCPPNGDGTKVNGEPDLRCKGDGAGKTKGGGAKGKASAKPAAKPPETKPAETKPVGPVYEKTPPINVENSIRYAGTQDIKNWSDAAVAYWSNQENIDAIYTKTDELNYRQAELYQKGEELNKRLAQYPSTKDFLGRVTYQVPPEDRESFRQERLDLLQEKAQLDREFENHRPLQQAAENVDNRYGADRVAQEPARREAEKEEKRKAEEKAKIAEEKVKRAQEKAKRAEEKANKQRIAEEKTVQKIATVSSSGEERIAAAEKAYKEWQKASDSERKTMEEYNQAGSPGGSFVTAYIHEDTETEQRFLPNKPILQMQGNDKSKFDKMTLESKQALMQTIKRVPWNGNEGQHIVDVNYKDGTKSTLRIVSDSMRVGGWENGINVQYSWILDWNY